jgi:CRP/FNR family cyclic AMP-dependent transcriptional regulator
VNATCRPYEREYWAATAVANVATAPAEVKRDRDSLLAAVDLRSRRNIGGAMSLPEVADLAGTALFANLDEPDLMVLREWLEAEETYVGQHLTEEGTSGYAFFVLHSGTADVSVDGSVVRTLGAGDYFGEIALLGEGRRTATVQVTTPGVVWTLFGTRFRQLQQQHPEIAAEIERSASARKG